MRNKIILLMLLSIITAFSYQESYEVLAHFEEIDVSYDECVPVDYVDENNIGDGINERWYSITPNIITSDTKTYHFYNTTSFSTQTVKYYVNETEYVNSNNSNSDNLWGWDTEFYKALNGELNFDGEEEVDYDFSIDNILSLSNNVKENFVSSMKKWDNIYVYNYDMEFNTVTKQKLINIIEGSSDDYNIIICPLNSLSYKQAFPSKGIPNAYISPLNNGTIVPNFTEYEHKHYSQYVVNVSSLNVYNSRASSYDRTGAHEFGHVLGLADIDSVENSNASDYHHEELIMGYSKITPDPYDTPSQRQTNITYKDIAGAMITMGFHTNNDHKWMYIENQDIIDEETGNIIANDGYKLICSICNGYKYSTTLPNGSVKFEQCKNPNTDISDHSLSSGNMMPVASYDNYDENGDEYDYYKCKYCRYVAPFTSLVKQDYQYESINNTYHNVKCNIDEDDDNETDYSIDWFNENHYSNYETNTIVPYPTNHPQFALKHIVSCGCNEIQTSRPHSFTVSDIGDGGAYNTCIDCNALIPANTGPGIVGPLSNDIWQVTDNGSYKLTNGIIILVEEDIQAYKEGTLVFKDANSEIM